MTSIFFLSDAAIAAIFLPHPAQDELADVDAEVKQDLGAAGVADGEEETLPGRTGLDEPGGDVEVQTWGRVTGNKKQVTGDR
jgi:hypothetical protein